MRRALWIAAATPVVWLAVGVTLVSGDMPGAGGHELSASGATGQERTAVPIPTMRVVTVARFRHGVDGWRAGAGSSVRHVARSDGALSVSRRRGHGRVGAVGPRLGARSGEELVANVRLRAVGGREPVTVQLVADGRRGRPVRAQARVQATRAWREVAVVTSPGTQAVRVRVLAGGPRRPGHVQIDTARIVAVTPQAATTASTASTADAADAAGAPTASPTTPAPTSPASTTTPGTPAGPAAPTAPTDPASEATTPGSATSGATGDSVPAACQGLDYSRPDQGELDWADEFTGTTVDTSRWRVRDGESLSYDQARIRAGNVSVADGLLDIEARREDVAGRPYTSGYLDTIGLYARQWGRWEVRAKLPTVVGASRGLWPAFWLRSEGSPGEIDVAEAWGEPTTRPGYRSGSYQWTVHEDTNSAPGTERRSGWGTLVGAPPVADDFHLYAVDWSPDCLVFSMDHQVVGTVRRSDAPWMTAALAGPVDIRLNLQVGQDYWGYADPTDGLLTALPAGLLVDYVRVYRPLGVD
ncbi:glycoside hydrolase family 16 protein [Nocardioides panacihumi]